MSREDNQCQGKVQYNTFEDGHAATASLNKRGKNKYQTYKCSACGFYHVGHRQTIYKYKSSKNAGHKKYDHESKTHTANTRFIKNK